MPLVTMCYTLHTHCELSSDVLYNRMANETRSANVMVRMVPSLKAVAERAAKDDARSLSSLIEKVLTDHLKAAGYLKPLKRDRGLPAGHTLDPQEADREIR
jgi:hypothetical protein